MAERHRHRLDWQTAGRVVTFLLSVVEQVVKLIKTIRGIC
jgi:hypothetical protein